MELVQLGRTNLRVSRLGFGCAAIGGHDYGPVDDSVSVAALHRASELGINFFDVADVYGFGHAESVLGKAFAGQKDRAVFATKVGVRWDDSGKTRRDLSRAWITRALEGSLRRLRVDCIHLYQIHWPDGVVPIEEAVAVLDDFRVQGKIMHIGCCNLDRRQLKTAIKTGCVESLQLPLNLLDRTRLELARAASSQGLSVLCYDVLARGMLTGKYDGYSRFQGPDTRARSIYFGSEAIAEAATIVDRLKTVAGRRGCTPAQAALRWALEQNGVSVALAGVKTPAQAEDNAASVRCMLPRDEISYLETGRI